MAVGTSDHKVRARQHAACVRAHACVLGHRTALRPGAPLHRAFAADPPLLSPLFRGSALLAAAQSSASRRALSQVQIWDTSKCRMVRSMDGHCGRVGVLAWNDTMLSSGSRDATIVHRDTRSPQHVLAKLHGHDQEVCGLKWAPNGVQLASGGNDNLLNVWDERRLAHSPPLYVLDHHKAAVKALAWCPWQKHVLASGGGTADRMIRFWNVSDGRFINAVDTHSQVCALQWSQHDKELVSSHGYSHNQVGRSPAARPPHTVAATGEPRPQVDADSRARRVVTRRAAWPSLYARAQLILWKYPSMVKVAELTGHTSRVLHMAQSPDGTTVVSAAADETLRFWKILGPDAAERRCESESVLSAAAWTGASASAWTIR
jgi:cell division cycle protein 20 (cofactor of APC complex)